MLIHRAAFDTKTHGHLPRPSLLSAYITILAIHAVGSVPCIASAQTGWRSCPPGRTASPDSAGHCCWPGQAWSSRRRTCLGTPTCPDGFSLQGQGCIPSTAQASSCTGGRIMVDNLCECPGNQPRFDETLRRCVAGSDAQQRSPSLPPSRGCPEGTLPVDWPPREGVSEHFCMDRTEVTVAAYRACPRCSAPHTGDDCNWSAPDRDNHPVNCVNLMQAEMFCSWRGGWVPTREQWQLAAQGSDGRTYPWGETAPSDQLCWNRSGSTCAVGSFPSGRSPFGLDDMSGNVEEWTSSAQSRWMFAGSRLELGYIHFVYGGSSRSRFANPLRATHYTDIPATGYNRTIGFRCALPAP